MLLFISLIFTVPSSVSLTSLVRTKFFQVLDAGHGNINEMPQLWWLADCCEEKCLLG